MVLLYFGVGMAVILGVSLLLVHLAQDRLLFRATPGVSRTPDDKGWGFEEAMLGVSGERTHVWHIPTKESTDRLILFSHGNSGNISERLESVSIFRDMGYNVILYDYGGYGISTGSSSEPRCYDDLRAVWRYATDELGYSALNIVLFGRSLGGGPTAQLATEVSVGAIVLESTFTSIQSVSKRRYPWFPSWLARKRFDNLSKVSDINSPLLVIHGKEDSIVPYAHGLELFDRAIEPKAFLDIQGEHHEGFWKSGALYTDGLESFFNEHLGKR